MKNFIKRIANKFSLLITLLIGILTLGACTVAEKTSDRKGAADETEQARAADADNKQKENKSDETKKPAEKKVLRDFKSDEYVKPQNVSKAETDVVLKYLLGDSWDKELTITSRVQGAFTKPNAKETLYFVTGCKDGNGKFISNVTCGHAGWNSAGWIAIYDGTTPVLKTETALGYGIVKVTDVNGDGINEIVSDAGYAQSGTQTVSASIGQIVGDKYEDIKGFKGYADNCAYGPTIANDKKKAAAVVVSYTPATDGKMPEFTEEYFQGQCKNDEVDKSFWKKVGEKEFDDIFDSLS